MDTWKERRVLQTPSPPARIRTCPHMVGALAPISRPVRYTHEEATSRSLPGPGRWPSHPSCLPQHAKLGSKIHPPRTVWLCLPPGIEGGLQVNS
jgi:hypothetical protein